MALNFGKNSKQVAIEPSSAFPLDTRSYFESLKDAEDAAATAKEAGSTETIYYYGQTLCVYDNDNKTVTLYIIQPPNKPDENPYLELVGAQADWNAESGISAIQNKPNIKIEKGDLKFSSSNGETYDKIVVTTDDLPKYTGTNGIQIKDGVITIDDSIAKKSDIIAYSAGDGIKITGNPKEKVISLDADAINTNVSWDEIDGKPLHVKTDQTPPYIVIEKSGKSYPVAMLSELEEYKDQQLQVKEGNFYNKGQEWNSILSPDESYVRVDDKTLKVVQRSQNNSFVFGELEAKNKTLTNNEAVKILGKNGNSILAKISPGGTIVSNGPVATGQAAAAFGRGMGNMNNEYSGASGDYSFVIGTQTSAMANNAFAFGQETRAKGKNSVAGGQYSETRSSNSAAIGMGVVAASGPGEIALGRWNITERRRNEGISQIFSIGTGNTHREQGNGLELFYLINNSGQTYNQLLVLGKTVQNTNDTSIDTSNNPKINTSNSTGHIVFGVYGETIYGDSKVQYKNPAFTVYRDGNVWFSELDDIRNFTQGYVRDKVVTVEGSSIEKPDKALNYAILNKIGFKQDVFYEDNSGKSKFTAPKIVSQVEINSKILNLEGKELGLSLGDKYNYIDFNNKTFVKTVAKIDDFEYRYNAGDGSFSYWKPLADVNSNYITIPLEDLDVSRIGMGYVVYTRSASPVSERKQFYEYIYPVLITEDVYLTDYLHHNFAWVYDRKNNQYVLYSYYNKENYGGVGAIDTIDYISYCINPQETPLEGFEFDNIIEPDGITIVGYDEEGSEVSTPISEIEYQIDYSPQNDTTTA